MRPYLSQCHAHSALSLCAQSSRLISPFCCPQEAFQPPAKSPPGLPITHGRRSQESARPPPTPSPQTHPDPRPAHTRPPGSKGHSRLWPPRGLLTPLPGTPLLPSLSTQSSLVLENVATTWPEGSLPCIWLDSLCAPQHLHTSVKTPQQDCEVDGSGGVSHPAAQRLAATVLLANRLLPPLLALGAP